MKIKSTLCDCEVIHEETVAEVRVTMPELEDINMLADFFKILGDKTRASIMLALDKRELCVCDLGALLNMTKSAISHQLKILKKANLVANRSEGKVIFYSLKDQHIRDIVSQGLEHIGESDE